VLFERTLRGLDEVAVHVLLREPLQRDADLRDAVDDDRREAGPLGQRLRGLARAPVGTHVDGIDLLSCEPLRGGARLCAAERSQRGVVDGGPPVRTPIGLAVPQQEDVREGSTSRARFAPRLRAGLGNRLVHATASEGGGR